MCIQLKRVCFIFLISICLFVTPPASSETTLKIGGNGSSLGSMKLLGAAFEKLYPEVTVKVLPSLGSSGGIKGVAQGALGVGLAGRQLNKKERAYDVSVIEYAKTPFIFIAGKDTGIDDLSLHYIIDILTAKTTQWPGGNRIRPILRSAYESDTLVFKKISPDAGKAYDIALSRKGMIIAMNDQENADLIEKISGAFGFSTLTQIITEKRPVTVFAYNGVRPGAESLADGSYPLYKPLYVVTRPEPSFPVREFIDFIRSAEGRNILEESGNLPSIEVVAKQ